MRILRPNDCDGRADALNEIEHATVLSAQQRHIDDKRAIVAFDAVMQKGSSGFMTWRKLRRSSCAILSPLEAARATIARLDSFIEDSAPDTPFRRYTCPSSQVAGSLLPGRALVETIHLPGSFPLLVRDVSSCAFFRSVYSRHCWWWCCLATI